MKKDKKIFEGAKPMKLFYLFFGYSALIYSSLSPPLSAQAALQAQLASSHTP